MTLEERWATPFAALALAGSIGACNLIVGIQDVPPVAADDGGNDATVNDGPGGDAPPDVTGGGREVDVTDAEGGVTTANPCSVGNGGCATNATCTPPADGGARTCTCNTGYSGDGLTCTATDACMLNNGGCSPNATCTSTDAGARTCACNSGYTGDGITCTGVAACAVNNGGCAPTAKCTSSGANMVTCTCNSGYSGDGMTCTPINACATNNGGCSAHQTCTSTGPGTNTCTCNADPACSSTGNVCVSSTAYATCIQDAQGCTYASAMTSCGAGATCMGGQCLLADGQTCVHPTDCASGACSTFYLDVDGDGHGATASGTTRVCGTTAPPGYVTSNDDCCDVTGGGANIFTGQTKWFTSATALCNIQWDYNCSGNIEEEVTQLDSACVPNPGGHCPAGRQWYNQSSVPGCGASASSDFCIDQMPAAGVCATGGPPAAYTQGCH